MRTYGNLVCDQPVGTGGQSRVVTPDGYAIPVCFRIGLSYIKYHFSTDKQAITLPQVVMMTNSNWDPTYHDMDHLSTQDASYF